MIEIKNQCAQGDVLFRRVDELPSDVTECNAGKQLVVAHSETGHHHAIEPGAARLFEKFVRGRGAPPSPRYPRNRPSAERHLGGASSTRVDPRRPAPRRRLSNLVNGSPYARAARCDSVPGVLTPKAMIYARHTDIPGLYDVFDEYLAPIASELTVGQLQHIARQRGEQFEIVPPPNATDAAAKLAGQ